MLEVRLLGQFSVLLDGKVVEIPSRPAQSLFAYLVLNAGIAHRRERLSGLLWPDSTEANARSYLRHALWRIRQAIADDYLIVDNISITYDSNSDYWLDVSFLERSLDTDLSFEHLCEDVSVYGGALLPGFYDSWITPERERLQSVFEHKMDALLHHLIEARCWHEILEWGERWIGLGHAPEPAYRALMIAHGGLGNSSGVATVYDRCVKALLNEMDVEPSEQTRTTYESLIQGEAPPGLPIEIIAPSPATGHETLPVLTTPFIGRRRELREIIKCLEDTSCRLLTLVGPGGIGKTRLALATADNFKRPGYDIYFIPLASVESPSLLVSSLAEELGISFYSGQDPKERLLNHLREKQALLILDNFEHLVDEAGLVSDIVRTSPYIQFLVTSRERLNLQGEWLIEIGGMDFPSYEVVGSVEDYSAIKLFLQHAQRLEPGFALTDAQEPYLVRICQLVDGAPLAIELAASWVRVLSIQEIAEELERNIDFLAASLRDVPERHRSLRAVFEQSWDLLSEPERDTFRRLSIFRGSFTREAARQIAGASLFTLSSLADKSLLRRNPAGRYLIHPTLVQYGRERLIENPDEEFLTGNLHCEYFATFLLQKCVDLQGGQQKEALTEIEKEIDDVRAGWRWAVEHANLTAIGNSLDALYSFYAVRGWFKEGQEIISNAIEVLRTTGQNRADDANNLLLAKGLARQGSLCAHLGYYEQAKALLEESLTIAHRLDTQQETVFALNALGDLAWDTGAYPEAEQQHRDAEIICRRIGDQHGLGISLDKLGFTLMSMGEFETAHMHLLESVEIAKNTGDSMGMASPLGNLGWVAYADGRIETAQECFEEAIQISEVFNNRMVMALDQAGLSLTLNALNQHLEAKQLAQESLSTARETGYKLAIVTALAGLGDALRAQGDLQRAKACILEGFNIATDLGMVPMFLLLLIVWAMLILDEGEYQRAVEILALVRQNTVGLKAFGSAAESRLTELRNKLPDETFEAAQVRGRTKSVEQTIVDIMGK